MVVCLAPAPTATAGFGSIVMVSRLGGAGVDWYFTGVVCFCWVTAFKNCQLKFLTCTNGTMVGFIMLGYYTMARRVVSTGHYDMMVRGESMGHSWSHLH